MEELQILPEEVSEQENTLVEAVWRAIVGNDTPKKEDGELIVLGYGSPEVKYSFRYKGKHAATLTMKRNPLENFSYFIESDSITVLDIVRNLAI